jgi:hypothetical protein
MNEIVGYDSMGNDNVPMDAQGNKTNEMGRGIDNFLRNLLGGEGVGGNPTPGMGILPQAPALGSAASGIPKGIQNTPAPQLGGLNVPRKPTIPNQTLGSEFIGKPIVNPGDPGIARGRKGPTGVNFNDVNFTGDTAPVVPGMNPQDTSGDPYTEADNMVPDGDQTTDPRYGMQPTPPKTAIPEPVGSNFSNMPTNTQMDAGRNGEGSMQTVETNNQAPLEWLLNQGGQGIDYVDDLLATGAISASNFGDQFISRPGSELDARTKARKAELEKYKAANSGNIGTALYKLLLQQQGGKP